MILHTVASAFDDDGFGMVEDPVEDGRGECGVIIEDFWPFFENSIGGNDDGPSFVAMADDLEEEISTVFVDREISEFIQDKEVRLDPSSQNQKWKIYKKA